MTSPLVPRGYEPKPIDFILFEDKSTDENELRRGLKAAEQVVKLRDRGFTIVLDPVTEVTSNEAFVKCLNRAESATGKARIVCLDLDLTKTGLAMDHVNASYAEQGLDTADTDDECAGGWLLARCVMRSGHPRQLLLFASERRAEDLIKKRARQIQATVPSPSPFDVLPGGLRSSETQPDYLVLAVEKWLRFYGHPLSRLHPRGCENWFVSSGYPRESNPFPHQWTARLPSYRTYVDFLEEYLAAVLQVPEFQSREFYAALDMAKKEQLHEYLKSLVGGCAACCVGSGRRLEWRHLPVLAAACAPPPGSWVLSQELLEMDSRQILGGTGDQDKLFFRRLVGDYPEKGWLQQLLASRTDEDVSVLESCMTVEDGCALKVKYETEALSVLAKNFSGGVADGVRPAHDSSGILFDLHQFLQQFGGRVELGDKSILLGLDRKGAGA
jgi:hypothetical protein